MAPTKEAISSAAAGDDKALDEEAREGRLVEPRLNVRNTAAKMVLDQTVGAAVNTVLFAGFLYSIQDAMAHRPATAYGGGPEGSLRFLLSGKAVAYEQVDWAGVLERVRANFFSYMAAGWRFWPFVSLFNFVFIKRTETRNLVGALAGVVWGVYISLFASG